MAYMAYHHYIQQGRLPREIDDMDIMDYLSVMLWHGDWEARKDAPAPATIEQYI